MLTSGVEGKEGGLVSLEDVEGIFCFCVSFMYRGTFYES